MSDRSLEDRLIEAVSSLAAEEAARGGEHYPARVARVLPGVEPGVVDGLSDAWAAMFDFYQEATGCDCGQCALFLVCLDVLQIGKRLAEGNAAEADGISIPDVIPNWMCEEGK